MSNRPNHRESGQEVLNEARNSTYGAIDVIPQVETSAGVTAPVGYQAPIPAKIINTDGSDNSYTSGGVYGQKVHVVGISDLFAEGTIAAGSSLTGHKPVAIGFKDGSGNNQFVEGTTTNGIEVDVTRIGAGTATIGSVKLTDGTDTATVASAVDSRNGLDIQHSSVASKQLLFFHSDNASHRLTGGATKDFPTDIPGGSTWFDLDGYAGFSLDWVDNTSGATGASLYAIWSDDQTVMAEEFPPGGNTQALFTTDSLTNIDNNIHKFIPKQARYVKLRMVNGTNTQGSTIPNVAKLTLNATPTFFTNNVIITNPNPVPVAGDNTDVATAASTGLVIAGTDSVGAPTTITPLVIDSSGNAAVKGTATAYTGAPIITTQKLSATGTESSVTAGTTSGTLVASSTSRLRVIAYNSGPYEVYYRLSSSACTTATGGYTGIIWPGCEEVIGLDVPYSGAVTCITPTGTGNSTVSLTVI